MRNAWLGLAISFTVVVGCGSDGGRGGPPTPDMALFDFSGTWAEIKSVGASGCGDNGGSTTDGDGISQFIITASGNGYTVGFTYKNNSCMINLLVVGAGLAAATNQTCGSLTFKEWTLSASATGLSAHIKASDSVVTACSYTRVWTDDWARQ